MRPTLAERLASPAHAVLRADVVAALAREGLLDEHGGAPVWPGDGTLAAVWEVLEQRLVELPGFAFFERYRRVRRHLDVCRLAPGRAAVARVFAFSEGRRPTRKAIRGLLGAFPTDEAMQELAASVPVGCAPGPKADVGLDDLLGLFPVGARPRLSAALEREVIPPVRPPSRRRIERAGSLRGEPSRVLLAVLLLRASSQRRSQTRINDVVAVVTRFDALVPAELQQDPDGVSDALDACLEPDARRIDVELPEKYHRALKSAASFLRETLGSDADGVVAMLPVGHRESRRLVRATSRIARRVARSALRGRKERIAALAARLGPLMVACENRVNQLERFFLRWVEVQADTQAGDPIGERRFECRGRVVRPDGTLGRGSQIVVFRLVREDVLLEEARAIAPDDEALARSCRDRARRPDLARRVHVVYDSVRPVTRGGECHEPFFVGLLRLGVLDNGSGLSEEDAARRRGILETAGLPLVVLHTRGLLSAPRHQRRTAETLRCAIGSAAPVLVPLANLLHALGIARIVVRMGVRWGARLCETRQLRMGCFSTARVNGRWRPVASIRPKAWPGETPYEIDETTLAQLRRVKELAHVRWFRDEFDGTGELAVPVVGFGDYRYPDAQPARYLLVGPFGPIHPDLLALFVRVLLADLASVSPHGLRRLFVTALGLSGTSRARIAVEVHHASGSTMTKDYDSSDLVLRAGVELPAWAALAATPS